MGWLFQYGAKKQDVIDDIVKRDGDCKTLRYSTRGGILWVLHKAPLEKDKDPVRFIAGYLLSADDDGNWGYKCVDESMGPLYYDCPKTYIRDASPPVNQTAADWRAKVLEYHKSLKGK